MSLVTEYPRSRRLLGGAALVIVTAVVAGLLGAPAHVASAAPAQAAPAQAADPINAKYAALGGSRSFLGAATGAAYTVPGGRARNYRGGAIYWSSATGAWSMRGLILDQYRTLGGPGGAIGFPTTDETTTPDRIGRFNHFAGSGGASIYWTPNTGAHGVYGAIRARWAALGWERGIGYPATDENLTPDGAGRYNHFTGGDGSSIYWSAPTGARAVVGDIRKRWGALGWERGRLGYPTSDEYAIAGGRRNDFSGGTISWAASNRATTVSYRDTAPPPPARAVGTNPSTWRVNPSDTGKVSTVAGARSLNPASRNGIFGTDLGHMFLHRGRLMMVFGDTFGGPAADDFFSVPHQDWRSNAMGWAASTVDPRNLRFSGMITDRPNHAKELLASKKIDGDEMTVIPTYGVSVGNRAFLHYMSVRKWGIPGQWTLNHSGIAYSDNDGATWTKAPIRWSGSSNFGQAAMVDDGGYVYVYGIPGGRYGGMKLARVPRGSVLTPSAYRYWTGTGWSADEYAATTIVRGPVGEMSVQYNSYYRKWLMMYLVDSTGEIVLRTSDSLTGPWSDAQVVVDSERYPALYAPYLMPTNNAGKDIWFTMSEFGPYTVSMMHTSLTPKAPDAPVSPLVAPAPAPTAPPADRTADPDAHGRNATPTTSTGG